VTERSGVESRIPELDGLRGIAILLVLVAHLTGLNGAGLTGVLMFFVLSGYLITRILVAEEASSGRIGFAGFYLRRALRLLPALGFLVAVVLSLAVLGVSASDPETALVGTLQALTYTTNFAVGFGWPFAAEMAHLWTLAVEEQFYIIWPAVLAFGLLRLRERLQIRVMWWILALCIMARLITIIVAIRQGWFFYALPTLWLECFMGGAILAIWTQRSVGLAARSSWATSGPAIVVALVSILLASAHPGAFLSMTTYVFGIPVLTASASCLIASVLLRAPGPYHSFLRAPALQWLGDRSYGLYLFNSACVLIVATSLGQGWGARAVGIAIAIVLAEVSRRWIERPALRLKARIAGRASLGLP
jgi:peptidoglycan/LPS O-acetylase OafA/YrhL